MALSKSTGAVGIPSRFREYNIRGHVADAASGELAGKLMLEFQAPGVVADKPIIFGGAVEDIPDTALTGAQRKNLRKLLRLALEYWRSQDNSVTGTPDADPDEPALT